MMSTHIIGKLKPRPAHNHLRQGSWKLFLGPNHGLQGSACLDLSEGGGQLGAVDGKWGCGAVGETQTHRKDAEASWIFCSTSIVFKIS